MTVSNEPSVDREFPRRVSASEFAVSDFITNHLINNQPVIIRGCTQNWLACDKWLKEDGSPDFSFLLKQFGNQHVPVTCCTTRKVQTMLFSDFIHEYTKNPHSDLYIRDWHFMSDSIDWYRVPRYFQSDWVNNDAITRPDIFGGDYKFCYMGGSNTSTSFHSDVFNSYSWSANICGKKRWYMLPEGCELHLSTDPNNITDVRADLLFFKAGGFIFDQLPGEIVFVPTGWYHQVHNTASFTISINHNWINGFNIQKVIDLMLSRLECCKKEVRLMRDDLTDHVKYVEDFLRLDYGLNLENAIKLCELIVSIRTELNSSELTSECECESNDLICKSCLKYIENNDRLMGEKYLRILKEQNTSLNQLEWLLE